MTEQDAMKRIEHSVSKALGDDVMNLSVANIHIGFESEVEPAIRAVCMVNRISVLVTKPASRWDVIKSIMPLFIRRKFPPKLKPVTYRIPFPAVMDTIKADKLAALAYYTDELAENEDALVEWCHMGITEEMRRRVYNYSIEGYWLPGERFDEYGPGG